MSPFFYSKMAKLRNPLHSFSASGSIGNTITYANPDNVFDGRGIAKMKIIHRRKSLNNKRSTTLDTFPSQKDVTLLFTATRTVAQWVIDNNLAVAKLPPKTNPTASKPLALAMYANRQARTQDLKFPGQGLRSTVQFRTQITAPTSALGYVMSILLTRHYRNFINAAHAWNDNDNTSLDLWQTNGDAPWRLLPKSFILPLIGTGTQRFVNLWIQFAIFRRNETAITRDLLREVPARLWIHPTPLSSFSTEIAGFKSFLSSRNDSAAIRTKSRVPAT